MLWQPGYQGKLILYNCLTNILVGWLYFFEVAQPLSREIRRRKYCKINDLKGRA